MMEAASSVEDAMDAIGGRQKGVKGVFSCFSSLSLNVGIVSVAVTEFEVLIFKWTKWRVTSYSILFGALSELPEIKQ